MDEYYCLSKKMEDQGTEENDSNNVHLTREVLEKMVSKDVSLSVFSREEMKQLNRIRDLMGLERLC